MDYYFPQVGQEPVHDAPDIDGNAGACPPLIIRFRIYPELDFSLCFGNPPETVKID